MGCSNRLLFRRRIVVACTDDVRRDNDPTFTTCESLLDDLMDSARSCHPLLVLHLVSFHHTSDYYQSLKWYKPAGNICKHHLSFGGAYILVQTATPSKNTSFGVR